MASSSHGDESRITGQEMGDRGKTGAELIRELVRARRRIVEIGHEDETRIPANEPEESWNGE